YDQEDRLNHRTRGLTADAVGTPLGAKALKAADHGDDAGENRSLADADHIGRDADGLDESITKLNKAHAELRSGHQHSAEHTEEVRKHDEQRQDDQQRDNLGQNQLLQ